MTQAASLLRAARIIPVLTITRLADAVPLARALVAGGVRTLEVTLRTPVGGDAARAIRDAVPDAVVGLGTVLTPADLELVASLGLPFAFSPGATPGLLDAATAAPFAFVPGVATASELMAAQARGFDVVKFFPAEPAGGLAALRALAAPFPTAQFCPTGGVGEDNAATYLAFAPVLAVGGSWIAPAAAIDAGDWDGITARARRAMTNLQAREQR